jgi:hypothetical protein
MKKIILIPFLVAFFVSCEKQPDVIKSTRNTPTKPTREKINCTGYLLVIDKADVDSDWLNDNTKYLCMDLTTECYLVVDLDLVSKDMATADWIKDNEKYIDFKRSYQYIEKIHNISRDPDFHTAVTNANASIDYFTLSFYDLKKKLMDKDIDYEKEGYQNFLQFELKSFLGIRWVNFEALAYKPTDPTFFSLPLMRAIENSSGLKGDFDIQFAKVAYDGNEKIIIKVLNTKGAYSYYDYSQIPYPFLKIKK